MPNWLKTTLKIFAGIVVLIIALLIGASIYVSSHKEKVLALITTTLNKNLNGKLTIGDMHTSFFKSFPGAALSLTNVLIRDSRFSEHHHTLLDAKNFDVSVNPIALLKGTISIKHINITNAVIDMYTDSTGYSNTAVFKKGDKKKKDDPSQSNNSSAQIGKFSLSNVSFSVNNQKNNKLFQFAINQLNGKMIYPDSGWRADLHLNVLAKSMAFNTTKGSFIKNKVLEGNFIAGYNEASGKINFASNHLTIGGDPFSIRALFTPVKGETNFAFHVAADQILWKHASSLVAANITKTLDKFNLVNPIAITAKIEGSFSGGDPYLYVTANVRKNTLVIPGATITDCNFNGIFTNNNVKGKGLNDENSIIKLYKLSGSYNHLPFNVDTGSIANLSQPVATGNFKSNFPAADLNYFLDDDVAKFNNGYADMNLRYKANIVDLRFNKPVIAGSINFKNADIYYFPRNLTLKNNSFSLNFTGNDLVISNVRIQSGRSIIMMDGRVNNFLNLYYSDPEKILFTLQVRSPELRLGEFLSFLNSRKSNAAKSASRKSNSTNITKQLGNVLEKGKADMHLKIAKVYYKKFLATDATADLLTTDDGIIVKQISLKHSGGSMQLTGRLTQDGNLNKFALNTTVNNVNIHEFFDSFDNFGLKDLQAENLKGFLSAKTQLSGGINGQGNLVPQSLNGLVTIDLRNGALLNFKPLISVGKFAFPFRDLKNITIPKLDGKFDIKGDKIIISPMQISSSVLNVDVAGTYGLTKGTDIALDIPLRDPKKDTDVTDKAELQKRRFKGIVLHIKAKDDENGKLKIGWNKDR